MKRPLVAGPFAWSPLVLLWVGAAISAILTPAFKTLDSESYQGTVSLTGEYTRGWPTVLLYEIFPPDTLAIAAQTVIYVIAWSVLLYGWTLYRRTTTNLVFGLVLVTFALTPATVGWNVTILSEPLTISFVVLGIGLLGLGVNQIPEPFMGREGSRSNEGSRDEGDKSSRKVFRVALILLASALCFSLAAVNRITVAPFVLLPAILLFVKLIRAHRYRRLLAATMGVCVLLLSYPVYFGSASNSAWNKYFGVSRTTIYFYYGTAVTGFSPQFSGHVFEGVIEGGPVCLRRYRAEYGVADPFQVIGRLVEECPAGAKWIDDEFSRKYATTLVSHPRVTLDHLLRAVPETAPGLGFSQALYGNNQVATMLPTGIISLFDASLTDQVRSLPLILWGLIGVVLTALGLRISGLRSERWWLGVGVLWMSGLGIVLTILALADELSRSAAPSTAGLILGAILLLQECVSRGLTLVKE